MENSISKAIEAYIEDWDWDAESEKYAFDLGKFLFAFIKYLEAQDLSEKTKQNHINNVSLIGMFEISYGFNEEFEPSNLEDGPLFTYEFERKVNDSDYAIQSYNSTWRKLDTFIKSGIYETYMNDIEKRLANEAKDSSNSN